MHAIKLEGYSEYVAYPVTIRMKLCGRVVGAQMLDRPGTFTMVGTRRKAWMEPSRLSIELLTNQVFVPYQAGIAPDFRRLAYLIERLTLICRNGEEVSLYTRVPPSIRKG